MISYITVSANMINLFALKYLLSIFTCWIAQHLIWTMSWMSIGKVRFLNKTIVWLNEKRSSLFEWQVPVDRDADEDVAWEEESEDPEERKNSAENVARQPHHSRGPSYFKRHHHERHLCRKNTNINFNVTCVNTSS